jgi:hypothetical protein
MIQLSSPSTAAALKPAISFHHNFLATLISTPAAGQTDTVPLNVAAAPAGCCGYNVMRVVSAAPNMHTPQK